MKLLFDDTGIMPEIRRAFVVYLAGYDRPMNELLNPKLQDIERIYVDQFVGMNRVDVSLDALLEIPRSLPKILTSGLDHDEKAFLISIKRGEPDWDRLPIEHLAHLPAIHWKLINLRKMNPAKHKVMLDRLISALGT